MVAPDQGGSSPVANILDRLEGVRRSSKGWTARCPGPNHRRGDRWPSLSVSEGAEGQVFVFCHATCTADGIVRAIGLELKDLFPSKSPTSAVSTRPRSRPQPLPRPIVERLISSATFGASWQAAKILAPLDPTQQRLEVLTSWDYLTDQVDIPLTMRLASLIRGVAMFRFCSAKSVESPNAIPRAVRRLLEEIDHG